MIDETARRRLRRLRIFNVLTAASALLFGWWTYQEAAITWATSQHELTPATATVAVQTSYLSGGADGGQSFTLYDLTLKVDGHEAFVSNIPQSLVSATRETDTTVDVQTWQGQVIKIQGEYVHRWADLWHVLALILLYPFLLTGLMRWLCLAILRSRQRLDLSTRMRGPVQGGLLGWTILVTPTVIAAATYLNFLWLIGGSLGVALLGTLVTFRRWFKRQQPASS